MNVAPHWLVYDSFGFPKSGLKGGGTDGPLSPPFPTSSYTSGTREK